MNQFGSRIKELRLAKALPLRKVAAAIDIDQGSLSKIESGTKKATQNNIEELAKFFKVPEKELKTAFLADKILIALFDEDNAFDALKMAEEQVVYQTKNRKKK